MLIRSHSFESLQDYQSIYQKMQAFTRERTLDTPDEIWLLEHNPVFTQGQAGKAEHLLNPGDIPIIQSDRGGQVTYHGPGQIMAYLLIDLKRRKMGVRDCVSMLENVTIALLKHYGINTYAKPDAPGIYVESNGAKICSLGLRVRKGCTYHGLCLNVEGDLSPFSRINPCGFQNLPMTQIKAHNPDITIKQVQADLMQYLTNHLTEHWPAFTQTEESLA